MDHKQKQRTAIHKFFQSLDRGLFVDDELQAYSGEDRPLPIGFGQTISQPSLVVQMTEYLDLDKTCRVLEVGTGSGYQTAFLAEFGGQVFSVERIAELSEQAQTTLQGLRYSNVRFKIGDGSAGWIDFAPYDRIIVTAGAGKVPDELVEQLSPGGKLLIPISEPGLQDLLLLRKDHNSQVSLESQGGVTFVEFKGKYGWD